MSVDARFLTATKFSPRTLVHVDHSIIFLASLVPVVCEEPMLSFGSEEHLKEEWMRVDQNFDGVLAGGTWRNPPKALHHFVKWGKYPPFGVLVYNTSRYFTHSLHFYLPLGGLLTNLVKYPKWGAFVNTGFVPFSEQKFQGLFRTFGDTFPISQGSIQCNKEPQVYVFFSSSTRAILSWRSFRVVGLDKVTTESQGLSRTDRNFQGLSRPWIFIFKFKDFQGAREPCQ